MFINAPVVQHLDGVSRIGIKRGAESGSSSSCDLECGPALPRSVLLTGTRRGLFL